MRRSLGQLNLDQIVDRDEIALPEGPVRLVLISGVSERNDNNIGVFHDARTAQLCARFLMELDSREHPEYMDFQLTGVDSEL